MPPPPLTLAVARIFYRKFWKALIKPWWPVGIIYTQSVKNAIYIGKNVTGQTFCLYQDARQYFSYLNYVVVFLKCSFLGKYVLYCHHSSPFCCYITR